MDFESFELAIYRRPEHPASFDEDSLQVNRREHHAYLASLRAAGTIVTNGAIVGHPDPDVLAMIVYCTGSVDTTRGFVDNDPAIRAGRFVADVMEIRCAPDTMIRKGTPISV